MSRQLKIARPALLNDPAWQVMGLLSAVLVFAALFLAGQVQAQGAGDLVVSPTRVVLEGRDRSLSTCE